MSAREVVEALSGRWNGSYGMVCCPCHEDREPSLSVTDGDDGRLLVHCFAGCDPVEVLRAVGGESRTPGSPSTAPDCDYSAAAREIWQEAKRAPGTLVEEYLRGRGIRLPVPPSIRYHPSLRHAPTGLVLPAMIAAVQGPDRSVIAIHRTFLNGKARKASVSAPKMALGRLGSGAARLAHAGPILGLAEGIEDALGAMQMTETPCWAALGSNRLGRVVLPAIVNEVRIFADGDGPGREAAEKAVRRYRRAGLKARAFLPPGGAKDFADAVQQEGETCV